MRFAIILAPSIYLLIYMITQNVVGARSGARSMRSGDNPLRITLINLATTLQVLGLIIAQDNPMKSFQAVRLVGALVIVAGLYLSMLALNHLGSNWVGGIGLQQGHKLVTTGPYRYVRHPLYSGMLVSALGIGLVTLSPSLFLSGLCIAGAHMCRISGEEQLLRSKFKKRYDSYAITTGMVIPRLRK